MSDSAAVATSGRTVDRSDVCPECGTGMLYFCPDDVPVEMFCGRNACSLWLKRKPVR